MTEYTEPSNYFAALASVACDTDKKNGLTYISWAEAWSKLKQAHPGATFEFVQNEAGGYLHGEGFVRTTVTIPNAGGVGQITHEMALPVMDGRNSQIKTPTTTDINKALMRCLAKNIALHGLGLYPYLGEDYPEGGAPAKKAPAPRPAAAPAAAPAKKAGGISKEDRAAIAAAARGKNAEQARAIYEGYGLTGDTPPATLDVAKVVAELQALAAA